MTGGPKYEYLWQEKLQEIVRRRRRRRPDWSIWHLQPSDWLTLTHLSVPRTMWSTRSLWCSPPPSTSSPCSSGQRTSSRWGKAAKHKIKSFSKLQDESVFPVTDDIPFPKNFKKTCSKILRRLYRIFVHVYIEHFDRFLLPLLISNVLCLYFEGWER